ncbi:MAG: hypothetical protein RR441_09875 [Longicatena sp.]
MWGLLQYDLKKNKKNLFITISIFLALILCLVMPKLYIEHNIKSAGAFAMMSCLFCSIFGHMNVFRKMFSGHFLKDSILNYTTVSKRVIVLKPIVFMILSSIIVFVVVYGIFWGLFWNVQDQIMSEYGTNATSFSQFTRIVASGGSILILLYSSLSLFIWNIMNVKEVKNESRMQSLDFLTTLLSWLLIILAKYFHLDLGFAFTILVLMIALLNVVSYYLYMRRSI